MSGSDAAPGTRRRLRTRFRTTYWSSLVANGATTQGCFFLFAGLAVLRAGDPVSIALQLTAQSLPALVLLLLLRSAASRMNFRVVLLWSLWLQAATAGAFALVSALFGYELVAALIVSALYALTSTVQGPGRRTVLADLYVPAERRKALATITAWSNAARLASPALAGVTLMLDLWPVWFAVDGILSLASALVARRAIRHLHAQAEVVAPAATPAAHHSIAGRSVLLFLAAYLLLCVFAEFVKADEAGGC